MKKIAILSLILIISLLAACSTSANPQKSSTSSESRDKDLIKPSLRNPLPMNLFPAVSFLIVIFPAAPFLTVHLLHKAKIEHYNQQKNIWILCLFLRLG